MAQDDNLLSLHVLFVTASHQEEGGHISCEHAQIVPGKLFLKLLVEAGLSTVF